MQPLSYAVELTQKLIRCPSVTPAEGGALDLLEAKLAEMKNEDRLSFAGAVTAEANVTDLGQMFRLS